MYTVEAVTAEHAESARATSSFFLTVSCLRILFFFVFFASAFFASFSAALALTWQRRECQDHLYVQGED